MSEAKLWAYLSPKLKAHGHFERVENGVVAGTPDVDFCLNGGKAGKIELKYSSVKGSTSCPLKAKGKGLRKSQMIWAKKRLQAGGHTFVIIGFPDEIIVMHLNSEALIYSLNNMTKEEMRIRSVFWGTKRYIDGELLAAYLSSRI